MSNPAAVPVAAQITGQVTGQRHRWWIRARRLGAPPKRVVMWSVISSGPMALLVIAGAILTYHGHSLLVESRQRVDHTYQVLGGLNRLFISVEDAETGQRSFIITGDDTYLEPYLNAVGQTDGHISNLRRLLDSSPAQRFSECLQRDRQARRQAADGQGAVGGRQHRRSRRGAASRTG